MIYVVPDVHGRKFWEVIKAHLNEDCEIIFLGDYVDPYSHEYITKEQAFENFKEIIDIARNNSNVHLLLGNHDLEYMLGTDICNCRCDFERYEEIKKLFNDNADLFNLAYRKIIDKYVFLFTHAGVSDRWTDNYPEIFDCNIYSDSNINNLFKSGKLRRILGDCGYERGGYEPVGSLVWADIREHLNNKFYPEIIKQIVGHTLIRHGINIKDSIYCLDTQNVFTIDDKGIIREYGEERPYEFYKV